MAAIEVEKLEREFKGGIKAVAGIDLEVQEGEVYGFLGPNGAGKTTTVRMLVTLLRPTGGCARVAGFDVSSSPDEVRRRIGVALQEAALDPLMTGLELVKLQATLQGVPKVDVLVRAAETVDRVGLTEAQDRRLATYSGGMRRRLDLAMALVHSPSVLFLDEPTTGLDPTSRLALWDEVRRLKSEGTTVFLTTQYLEEADELANRVGIISRGLIVAEGTPESLKAEIGSSRLQVKLVGDCDIEAARTALERFGQIPENPDDGADLTIAVKNGAEEIAPVVRALDDAGIKVESLELHDPTLDDVFLAKTGEHLDEDGKAATDAATPAV